MFRKWLYRFQEMAGFTEKECQAFLILSLLIGLGAVARYIPKLGQLYDDAYYAPIDAAFERLAARADSADIAWMQTPPENVPVARPWLAKQPINLNDATSEELQRLPRIGPAMAARILAFRERMGRFSDVSDLMMIQGIGEKTFALIRDSVTVRADSIADENTRITADVVDY